MPAPFCHRFNGRGPHGGVSYAAKCITPLALLRGLCHLMRFGFVLVVLALLAMPAAAQNSTIQGQVSDPQGAAIPDAQVSARNNATGVVVTVTTNSAGLYLLPSLLVGQYRVEASKQGFGPEVRDNVRLEVAQSEQLNFVLQLGHVTQRVTVQGTGEVLNTVTSTVSQTISNAQVIDLPLNGRNYLQLGLLTPGTAPAYGSRADNNGVGGFTAVGAHGVQVSIYLDGANNDSIASGGEVGYQVQAVTPPIDAINEFAVITDNNSAEYGVRMGGTVIASLKSGTNRFHGDGWEFFRNQAISAANFFSVGKPKPALVYNQFGGTIGGPIKKDKAFFFVSYQGTRNHSGTTSISTVPTAAELQGNFAGYKTIYDPTTTTEVSAGVYSRTAFANNVIPQSYWDPVATKVLALYPSPNGTGITNNYYFSGSGISDNNEVDSRVDYNFSSSERLYGHYSHRTESDLTPGNLPYPADGGSSEDVLIWAHSGVIGLTSTISPTLVNELNASLTEYPTRLDLPPYWTSKVNMDAQLGITGIAPLPDNANSYGMTYFNATNYASVGPDNFWPNINFLDTEQLQDKLMWSHGHHMLKFGAEYLRFGTDRVASRYSRGNIGFVGYFTENPQSRATTGDGIADFLLGYGGSTVLGNINGETNLASNYGGFAQDAWQVSKRLTVNLGVRWDLYEPPHFRYYQNVSRFDPFVGTPDYGQFQYPTSDSDTGGNWNYHNFAPRLGIAFQATPKTVVRSGFGLYYSMTDSYVSMDERFFNMPPVFTEITFSTDELFSPTLYLKNGFPSGLLPTTTIQPNVSVDAVQPNFPDQYGEQWFFDVQRELTTNTVLTVSYMGNGSHHLTVVRAIDQPVVAGPGSVQSRRPFTQFSAISMADPLGNEAYNGLAVKLEKRYSRNLSLLSSYTYSHAIDNVSEVNSTAQGQGIENNYNFQINRGNSEFDLRHVFVSSALYNLPFGVGQPFLSNKGLADAFLGGWRLGGIITIESGPPFTPTESVDLINNGTTDRPNAIADGNLPRGQRSIADWFNLAAFTTPAAYTYGTANRDCLYSPGIVNLDMNLAKDYHFTESKYIEVRAEAFDFTNTPHFGVPAANVNLAGAGTITSLATGANPRLMQLALKIYF